MNHLWRKKKFFLGGLFTLLLFVLMHSLIQSGLVSRHIQSLSVPVGLNMILALSLFLLVGMLGELSLGHAGFMSIGAYAGGLFSKAMVQVIPVWIRFPLALCVGALVAALLALLLSVPVFRLKGDYLAIVTLAFGEIVRSLVINLPFTGGAAGLKGIPKDTSFSFLYWIVVFTIWLTMWIYSSKIGLEWRAIRDNAIAAEACGIPVVSRKRTAFVVAASLAGVAGVLYSHHYSILTAEVFGFNRSIEVLVMVVLGGLESAIATAVSAFFLTIAPEMLRFLNQYRMLIYSLVLIIVMIGRNTQWEKPKWFQQRRENA